MAAPPRRLDAVRLLFALLALGWVAVAAIAVHGAAGARQTGGAVVLDQTLVHRMRLTDLALWSGASYCRHPCQLDRFAPHAQHPSALEHLPAGSVFPLQPPRPSTFGSEGTVWFEQP